MKHHKPLSFFFFWLGFLFLRIELLRLHLPMDWDLASFFERTEVFHHVLWREGFPGFFWDALVLWLLLGRFVAPETKLPYTTVLLGLTSAFRQVFWNLALVYMLLHITASVSTNAPRRNQLMRYLGLGLVLVLSLLDLSGFSSLDGHGLLISTMLLGLIAVVEIKLAKGAVGLAVVCLCFFFLSNFANVTYYSFFGGPLEFWSLIFHWKDLFVVHNAVGSLAQTGFSIMGIVWFVIGFGILGWGLLRSGSRVAPADSRLKLVLGTLVGALLGIGLLQTNSFMTYGKHLQMFSDGVAQLWFAEGGGDTATPKRETDEAVLSAVKADRGKGYISILAEYRDKGAATLAQPSVQDSQEETPPIHQLEKPLEYFGIQGSEKPNVVVLFLESVRAYELMHPQLREAVFPNLTKWLEERALYFSQAYNSSIQAGQTARGKFATLCSFLPNMLGPATYMNRPQLNQTCLPQTLQELGYQTISMRPSTNTFHNAFAFESYHGTGRFFDRTYYDQFPDQDRYGSWGGLSDGPFLRQVIKDLEKAEVVGPTFAEVLTLSTHYPHPWVEREGLPQAIRNIRDVNPQYASYLNALHYSDEAVGHFFEAFFDTEFGANSLLVVLGDHAINIAPSEKLNKRRQMELRHRIPLAFLSKNLATPMRVETVAHQVDVAPTIISILGAPQPRTWLGKNLFASDGSAWVAHADSKLSFRTEQLGCYGSSSSSASLEDCVAISLGEDPMWAEKLIVPSQNIGGSWTYFSQLVRAIKWAIQNNQIKKIAGP